MAKCELQNVNCPVPIYEECSVRPQAEELQSQLKKTTLTGEAHMVIEDKLRDLVIPKCPLEEKIFSILDLEDLTDKQLELIGAERLDKTS